MELKIYIKQATQFNAQGVAGVFIGTNPQTLQFTAGINNLPTNRQIFNYPNFIDATDNVSDLYKLKLTWSTAYEQFEVTDSSVLPKKSASGTLTFEGDVYTYIRKWLIDDVSAPFNAIAVRIVHVGCGSYEDYQITAKDITWCDNPNLVCTFDVVLKQKDQTYTCIQKTLISDNWQGWFQDRPLNGKKHPRFSYCNEQRPNGVLIAIWVLLSIVFTIIAILSYVLYPIINIVIGIINALIAFANAIINFLNFLGFSWSTFNTIAYLSFDDLFDSFAAVYLESAGCGREHPAPFVRDYIQNVCAKCGVTVTPDSAPLFFSSVIKVNSNADGDKTVANPYYNECYFYAPVQRGVRRFESIGLFSGVLINKTDYYIYDNRPLLALDQFLDEQKAKYNFEWVIKIDSGQPTLFIQRKDYFKQGALLYDFSKTSPDVSKINGGICYEWNDNKFPASMKGMYAKDATDKPGNESLKYFNDIVSFGLTDNNPNYDGMRDGTTNFGGTKFRLDGASEDYLYGAFQIMLTISGLILPLVNAAFIPIRNRIVEQIEDYADYALLIEGETCLQPKGLIWDSGSGFENSKVQKYASCVQIPNYAQPQPNLNYSSATWQQAHPPITKVAGSQFSIGYYHVQNILNTYSITKPALIMNYPLIMGVNFKDTLWDWFLWIDDPAKNPLLNQQFTVRINLCCEDLVKLGVFGDTNNIKLLQKVKLPLAYYQDGVITEITVSYDPDDVDGQYIEIKGYV